MAVVGLWLFATLRLRIVLDQVAPVQQLQQVAMVDVLLFSTLVGPIPL